MTLTHLLPTLRRSIPDPMTLDRWPEFTVATVDDVTVAGVSLTCLVDWCETPCVHTAAAVVPGTGGRPSDTELASVVVARVTTVENVDGHLDVWLDADLDGCHGLLSEARLIGRTSTARGMLAQLRPASVLLVELPSDLRVGDLIAVPCIGVTRRRDILPMTSHRERLSDDRLDGEPSHCGR
jgi:hypothetical protein